jgi:large subunit ribosomal protein L15
MYLNSISPAENSRVKRKRVGRGIGCTLGKTCGRGHKGQHARSGGYHKTGFEGGQMPLQRRLPKVGFKSTKTKTVSQVSLNELNSLGVGFVDLQLLISTKIISRNSISAKVINSGNINKPIILKGLKVTESAKKIIIDAGGRVEE